MDTMDNVHMGKYDPKIVIIDGMGWVEQVGPRGYRKSSKVEFFHRMHEIKETVKEDLFVELEPSDHMKAQAIFDFCWEHGHKLGVSEVVSWFRELMGIVT